MCLRLLVTCLAALVPSLASADALADLRETLGRLAATTPVKGTYEVSSTSKSDDDEKAEVGKARVEFEVGEGGLHLVYPPAVLTQAHQEARSRATDAERSTPLRSGLRRIRPLQLAELLDAAAVLALGLEGAQLVETKSVTFRSKPARLVVLKLTPKLAAREKKHIKKLENTLSVWLGEDGAPIAAEESTTVKASILLMSIATDQKQSWTFSRAGDRLITTRYEETQKSDGLGQHSLTQTTEIITLE